VRATGQATLNSAEAYLSSDKINRGVVVVRVIKDEVTELAYSNIELVEDRQDDLSHSLARVGAGHLWERDRQILKDALAANVVGYDTQVSALAALCCSPIEAYIPCSRTGRPYRATIAPSKISPTKT
jgi:hypothetical protein